MEKQKEGTLCFPAESRKQYNQPQVLSEADARVKFKYRYVAYGTGFVSAPDFRAICEAEASKARKLYENELALDVGGVCWGFPDGEQKEHLPILDHHFDKAEFPSASAAVLHNALRIREKFAPLKSDAIWLVAHQDPDFDAFCASYLARSILEKKIPAENWQEFGLRPDGWKKGGKGEIDWYNPDLRPFCKEPERRWAVLLAAYASSVDGCRRLGCPKRRALHSILYAAISRGRNYISGDDPRNAGAFEFFDEARKFIVEKELNPLFDSIGPMVHCKTFLLRRIGKFLNRESSQSVYPTRCLPELKTVTSASLRSKWTTKWTFY